MTAISNPLAGRSRGDSADIPRDLAYEYRRRVGAWLREARLRADMTQQQLADRLGMGFTAVSAVETGRNAIPPERYEALADALGIDHAEFGKFLLRYTNPWCYALIYGTRERSLREDLGLIPERLTARTAPKT